MEFDTGKIYDDTLTSIADGKEVVVNKGGTRSGKTWSEAWTDWHFPKVIHLSGARTRSSSGLCFSLRQRSCVFLRK